MDGNSQRTQREPESTVCLKRRQLLDALNQHVYNDLPAHLIRTSDMKLLSRDDLWEDRRDFVENLSDRDLLAYRFPKEDPGARVKYAIFSHRWGAREPSYEQLSRGETWMDTHLPPNNLGHLKLRHFRDRAHMHYCHYAWSDTCCIDKSSSAELEEAIRAMYRWYRDAEVCIVHLAATDTPADFEHEPWFTRGWTLQELLAPKRITFYNKNWDPISINNLRPANSGNDKEDWQILVAVSKVTGIPVRDLRDFRPGCERVAEKMRWASQRETTRVEDAAYALLGIFDITMPISYGEGKWAFHRLTEGISQRCSEPGFFAWAGDASPYSFALPRSPKSYGMPLPDAQISPVFEEVGDRSYSITKLGLQVKLLLLPVRWIQHTQESYTLSFTEGTLLETDPSPTLSRAYYELFELEQYVLGVVNYTQVEGNRGMLRVGERYICLLLKPNGRSGYIKARSDHVLVYQCVKGVTRDLKDVCLSNTLDS